MQQRGRNALNPVTTEAMSGGRSVRGQGVHKASARARRANKSLCVCGSFNPSRRPMLASSTGRSGSRSIATPPGVHESSGRLHCPVRFVEGPSGCWQSASREPMRAPQPAPMARLCPGNASDPPPGSRTSARRCRAPRKGKEAAAGTGRLRPIRSTSTNRNAEQE